MSPSAQAQGQVRHAKHQGTSTFWMVRFHLAPGNRLSNLPNFLPFSSILLGKMPSNSHTPCQTALQHRHGDTKPFSLTLETHATRGSAGGLVVIFAWRMPTCGWIDFTSNAGFGPPIRRVEMWPLPSSVPQVSVGGPRHVSGWQEMPVFAWVPILNPWWNLWTLWQVAMVSTQANGNAGDSDGFHINKSDGTCSSHLLTIHLSDDTGRCYLEWMTGLQVSYSHTNRSLADLTQKPSTKHKKRISPSPQSTMPDPQPDTQSFRSIDSKPRDPDLSQIQLKEPQSEPSTTEARENFTRFMVPRQPGGVQPESNPGDHHHHSQTPYHNLSTQARKKIHHQGSLSSRPSSSIPSAHLRLSRHQVSENTHQPRGSEMFGHL